MINPRKEYLLVTTVVLLLLTCLLPEKSLATECGGELTEQAGYIVSPNYPSNYPTNTECRWQITVGDNQIIDFRFKSLDLDRYSDQNCLDWVSIYSGTTEQDERIGYYCGYNDVSVLPSIKMRSKGNTLLVVFKSHSQTRKGFRANYWAHECPSFKYGLEVCNNTCACNATNAYSCDNYDGTCHCNVDWRGPDCSEIIPHCKEPSECNDPYEICVNVPGTFECQCRSGMVRNENGECEDSKQCVNNQCSHACAVTSIDPHQETCYCPKGTRFAPNNSSQCLDCPQWYYGDNCAFWTPCSPVGTESYNRANGLCHCHLNWATTYCDRDVDECAFEIPPCNLSRSACLNSVGSYECRCHPGFENFEGVPCDDCGKTLSTPSATIFSGIHSEDRTKSPNTDCTWLIRVQEGNVISLVFQRYDMHSLCWAWWIAYKPGYVEIFDGNDSSAALLYTSKGSEPYTVLSQLVRSTVSEMYIVRYPSDCTNYGFDFRYWSHECPYGMYDSNCSTACTCELSNSRCDSVSGRCVCHPGWTSENCTVDVDECGNITACPEYSDCRNLIGSYECACWEGLVMSSSNQCLPDNSTAPCSSRNCSHTCVTVAQDNSTTEQCYCPLYMELVGDECLDCINLKFGPKCQESCLCNENTTTSCDTKTGQCRCKSGWTGQACGEDINECYYSRYQCPAHSNCINTIGGYSCLCDPIQGYTEAADGGCKLLECHYALTNATGEIKSPLYPDYAPSDVDCIWNITVEDHNVVTVRFQAYNLYWYPLNIFDGINEQSPRINIQPYPQYAGIVRSTGNNLLLVFRGSQYRAGLFFGLYSAEECPDHMYGDYCQTPCSCVAESSYCNNIDGTCTCHTGWTGSNCSQDINECLDINKCPDYSLCYNSDGGYECRCHDGLKLDAYNHRCICHTGWTGSDCSQDINECLDINKCPDYSLCYNSDGGYECRCHDGLKLDAYNHRCILGDNATSCNNKTCQYLCASYSSDNMSSPIEKCYCPKFQELDEDSCVGCKGLTYGRDCDLNCMCQENNTDDCYPYNGQCYCKSNWTGPQCTDDFDECSYGRYTCPPYTYCSNTHGGYDCLCSVNDGYTVSSNGSCVKAECNHILMNETGVVSVGADLYTYYTNNAFCTWIITVGKDDVISLRFTTFYTPQTQDYMDIFDGGNSSSPSIGHYIGYVGNGIIRSTGNQMYIEFISDAYYNYGYFYGNYYSHKCPDRMYGDYCQTPCSCVAENSYCNNIDGTCTCHTGWTGSDCSQDINECLDIYKCPDYSLCYNSDGGYECRCHDGLKLDAYNHRCILSDNATSCTNKTCQYMCARYTPANMSSPIEQCYCPIFQDLDRDSCVGCKGLTYGRDCDLNCVCQENNTDDCYPYNGQCYCKPNWTGPQCTYDFDECAYGRYSCPSYTYCSNTQGGYECLCNQNDGYTASSNGSCIKIECNHVLNDTSGVVSVGAGLYTYYTNNAFCTWIITAPKDNIISLRFVTFYTPQQQDYMDIYDGGNFTSPLIGRYFGNVVSSIIRSSGKQLYIEFISDGYNYYGYFYGNYYSHKCPNFTYGVDACDKSCRCVKENTQFCDNVIGECICKTGWTLGDCSADINECLGKVCPLNSDCTNTKGSYRCECHLGYIFNSTTKKCDENFNCVHKKCSHGCYIVKKNVEQCVCPDGLVLDDETEQTCVVPYYPYGSEAGDYKLDDDYVSYGNKKISHPIYFTSGAPFGDEHQPAAFVTSHGAIVFGEQSMQLGSSIDLTFLDEQSLKVIAPFLSSIDPSTGKVFYHLYEKYGDKFGDSDRNQAAPEFNNVLARAVKDIKEFYGLYGFDVNIVFVVTWVAVKPYSLNVENTETNTFQAVFISGWEKINQGGNVATSDEETAYVIFLYQNGKMNWNYMPGRAVSIGVTGKMFSSLKDLDTPLVALLDKIPGNTGLNGIVSFEVGRVKGSEATCNRRLINYLNLLTDEPYQNEIRQLYKCPCTIERLGLQWELYEKRGINSDIYCYTLSARTKRRFFYFNYRNQLCCYKWQRPATSNWADLYRTWREASYISASYDAGHILIRDPWYISEFQENLLTHQLCCGNTTRAKFCGRFYKIFPDRGCSNFVPFLLASAFGDPHITTLDGLTYTMNGWGEWILLDVPDDKFYLQARTGKAETANGTLSNATVFTAFAAKESNESSFQVELSSAKTSMVILVNGIDITNNFYKSSESEILLSTDFITVSREVGNNNTLFIISFSCGVSVKVHAASKSLLVELDVLKDLQNKTRGLLGNFNGNKADEFTLSDGTVLPSNISEREIYQHFAKSWLVTADNSVFVYPQGESTDTYQHLDFQPMYRDEADPAAVAKAVVICGDKNDACIFDYLVTGDKSFAESTKNFKENIDVTVVKLANNPPTIWIQNGSLEANGHWFVYQGKPSYIQVIMDDEDNDVVTLEILDNVTGVSANQSGVIKYVPDIKNPILLSVRAKDSKGSYSPALSIPLTVCPNCSYHGSCDTNIIKSEFEGGKFQTLACKCLSAYTGENCESEIDACEVHPCFKGQTCTDLTAAQQGNSTIGYTCGPCPSGFVDSLITCIDINECTNTSLCDQKCVNTEGSYTCVCNDGYIIDSKDRKCKDVNECDGGSSNCEQICLNTVGNYTCSCQSGYLLDENGRTCSLDEKNVELCYACSQVCIVGSDRTVTCGCKLGYDVDPADSNSCRDIDECQSDNKTCSQICTNKVGTYECSCFTGFKLSVDKMTCAACQTPFYGMNCSSTCQCNGRGTCDPVKGCVCNSHWTGSHCETDVDECTQPDTCHQGFVCVNTVGSFKCACPDGYQLQNESCKDIDECKDPSVTTHCDPTLEICVNNIGSYSCQCVDGYARLDQSTCSDVDECSSNTDKCEQICENKPGQYNCMCYEGFKLDDNRFTCTQDVTKDPCTKFNLTCTYGCRLDTNSTANCFCPRGYTLMEKNDCQDTNECLSDTENLCTNKSTCENTNGSYTCSCQVGMKLDNDGRSCIACKGGLWGKDCLNSCSCGPGAEYCDAKTGCVCKSGFTGSLCDQDVDECATGQLSCQLHEKCVNYAGGASCECEARYEKINGTCEASSACTFKMCSIDCSIVNGTETCSCPSGKKLLKDGVNCADCAEGQWGLSCVNSCNCSSKVKMYCDKVNGSCLCKSGWTGIGCDQDVDECTSGSYSCLPNMHCNNTAGAYNCLCDDGFVAKGGGCKKIINNTMSAKFMWDVSGRNLENKTGDDYLRTKQEVETQMKSELVKSGADVVSLIVTNLRKGSLIVEYVIVITNDTMNSFNSGLQDLMKNGIVLDGKIITVAQILNGNNTVSPSTCLVRQKLDPCVNPTVCVEEGGTTLCKYETPSERNTSLVLGLAIGLSLAGIIICFLITMIVCYIKSHNRKFVSSVSCETLQPSLKNGSGLLSHSGSTNFPHYFEGSLGEDKLKNSAPTQTMMTGKTKE